MDKLFENLQKLKAKYPESVAQIEADSKKVRELMQMKEFQENPVTKTLIDICRKAVVAAKTKLATDRSLINNPEAQRELWFIIESREWFLQQVVRDVDAELERFQSEVEMELSS